MLRHSENKSENTSGYNSSGYSPSTSEPMAASPYTAEEIANAIAEIEREKFARNAAQSGTAQISSVLEHLNLDMSPTDVAARIEKQRLTRVLVKKTHNRRPLLVGLVAGLACIGILIGTVGLFLTRVSAPAQEATTVAVAAPMDKVAIANAGGSVTQTADAAQFEAIQNEERAALAALQARKAVLAARAAEEQARVARSH